MLYRLFSFLLSAAMGAGIGGLSASGLDAWLGFGSKQGLSALVGCLAACMAWFLVDAGRGLRLVRWLRKGAALEADLGNGLWGEAADRMRKLLRAKDRALKESEERLQDFLAALQASPNGVVLLDGLGRIEWFNQTAAGHFGFDVRRDLMQHFGNLVREPAFASYWASADWGAGVTMPGRGCTASKPVRLMVHLHPYGEGRKLLLSRDVTMVEQAEAMRRDFVANVSHEIRTPLTVLAGFVETMQTLPLQEEERQRYLELMAQQTQRMQSLVSDLLTLSRLEGSPVPSRQEWVALEVLMDQCGHDAQALSQVLHGRNPTVLFDFARGYEIAGSHTELQSALGNLVANAVRYCTVDAPIRVQWQQQDNGDFAFSVADAGPGIAPQHIARLTERFYRIDRSRSRESGGTGLGLAIVKHVAQRHGAQLRVESQPGVGSTFTIAFPSSRVRDNALARAGSGAAPLHQ